jgi:hypothetical protein
MPSYRTRLLLPALIRNPTAPQRARRVTLRIDTGAVITVIDPTILHACGIVPQGTWRVQGVTGVPATVPRATVTLDLGPGGTVPVLPVVGLALPSGAGADGLAGDDLLARGVLVWNGPAGVWSFQVPTTPTITH